MKQFLILGVDVSKSTLDVFFKPIGCYLRVSNDLKGFKQLLEHLKRFLGGDGESFVVMEHTGRYSLRFESFLRKAAVNYCKISALQIKRSQGVLRGKTDKVDAERIAEYGWLRRELLIADVPVTEKIIQLQDLLNLRQKLVRDRSGYISRLKEMCASGTCTKSGYMGRVHLQTIAHFTRQITEVEVRIKVLVKSDEKIQRTCELLRSIKGIGWIVACYMICKTKNFTSFTNARKFNCYAGIAPFAHESGSSISRRARVSHLANKEVKTLLNLAASTAVRFDQELRAYYHRKVAEGKSKMCCINNVRAKLVARMFAVIKRQTPYQMLVAAA